MNNPVVLTEKLRRPDPAGLSRSRLEGPLLHGGASRLALVVAPPGSGKTTLLAQVAAAAAAEIPVAWYRITAHDSAEATLVAHLGRALHDALGVAATATRMADLLESLEQWSGCSAILILDDLHEIAGSAAERSLEQFVELRPHGLRVLAGSRRQPEMNIPRLRVSGLLQEISNDDLRFRSWEVEELFISVFQEPLSPESAAALTRRTGGWAAGLQLFHLATSGRSVADRQRAVDDLGGRSKLVRSYLARNVLAELPPDRREFLLRTCTLGTLTGELCDALLETSGSHRVLDEFEQQQLFTSSEDDGETFRYHEVLRTHLEWALVEEYGAAGARQWYSRSAALLESIGDQRAAVRAYARAEDWGAVARLIQARGSGPDDAVAGTDLLLPAAVVEHDPWLTLAEARRRVREGALGAAIEKFRQAERLLDEPEFRERCRRERSIAAVWTPGGTVGTGWMFDGHLESRHWSVQIRAATVRGAPTATPGRAGRSRGPDAGHSGPPGDDLPNRLGRGIAALLAGEFHWARTIVNSVENDPSADPTLRLLAQLGATVIDLVTVGSDDPSTRLGQIALDAELAGLPWVARLARGLGEAALVALGSPAWRMTACVELLDECERAGDLWGAALLRLAAAIAGQLADPAADPDEFTDAASRFRRLEAPVLALWAESLQACVLARDGRPAAGEFAHRVATHARAVQLDGAEALAVAALAVAAGGDQRPARIVIGDTANSEGVRGAMRLLTGPGRPTPVPARPMPTTAAGNLRARPVGSTPSDVLRSAEPAATPAAAASASGPAGAGAAPLVTVQCFAGFAIEVDGTPVDLRLLRPRARALLRMLALSPDRDVHREQLIDALWPGVELTAGTRRLQVAVSSVRQVLEQAGLPGSDVLSRRGDAYRLALPIGGTIDVREFERGLRDAAQAGFRGDTAAGMAAREAALALYRGDVLPEDGPADYVVAERDRLRLAAAAAALALAQDSRTLGHSRRALAAARMSVQLDRFSDLGWELLVGLHEQAGDNSAAERARQEHAQVQAELGVAASAP